MVEWETEEITIEPLKLIASDDPVTYALYGKDKNLLEEDGWRSFRNISKRQNKLLCMANQAKLRSFCTAPKYKYGYEVLRHYKHAKKIDLANGNNKWHDCTKLEMAQLDEYNTFIDYGRNGKPLSGYKRIKVHLIFNIKHDGRHKARCINDGHLTDIPINSVYSVVVSLCGLRIVLFLIELNRLYIMGHKH